MESYKPFLDFIRYTLSSAVKLPQSIGGMDWWDFLDFSQSQGIAGIVFDGIERSRLNIPQDVLFEWIGLAETIKSTNVLVNKRTVRISNFFKKEGYRSCILKGQANATMYPRQELRSPGDIDIWVSKQNDNPNSNDKKNDDPVEIIRLVLKECPDAHYSLHHVTMPVFDDTAVEVHYRPIFLDNWLFDKRFKYILETISNQQFDNKISLGTDIGYIGSLTDDFNALYQMLHMWHHLLSTHNNLKQLIDYYYLLKRGLTDDQKAWVTMQFCNLGLEKYARGIMWIEQSVLGLDSQHLILQPDERIGQLLFHYVLGYGKRTKRSRAGLLIHRVTDNLPLFRYFPLPVLINPIYLIWHQWWKLKMKYKLKVR